LFSSRWQDYDGSRETPCNIDSAGVRTAIFEDIFVDMQGLGLNHRWQLKTTSPFLALLSIAFFTSLTFAQSTPQSATPPAAATPAASPAIITSVDEVTLDLVVRQKNKPVLDLKPGDLAVTDNGLPVKLSDLHLVTGESGAHRVTLVFDRLEPSAAKNAYDIAGKMLKAFPVAGFSFSVMNVGGRLRLYQEFTDDRTALNKAIAVAVESDVEAQQSNALPEKNLTAAAQTGMDPSGTRISAEQRNAAQVTLAALHESQRITQDQHSTPGLASLLALARTQRQMTGRKVVIYFAPGMTLNTDAKDMLRSIIGAANRSGVSIYAVDANAIDQQAGEGLLAALAMGGVAAAIRSGGGPTAGGGAGGGLGGPRLPPGMLAQINDTADQMELDGLSGYKNPLAELAASTGGAYIVPTDSLKKPLQQLIEDMTTYYEASYTPPIQEYDGHFRPVSIKPVRKGIQCRSRAGYFALPSGSSAAMRPFEAPLMKTLTEPQLPEDVKFRSSVIKFGDLPDGNSNTLVVEVPLSELEIREDPNAGLFSAHVSIVAEIKNTAGTVIEHFSEDVPRHGALETLDKARSDVVTLQRHFVAGPGEYVAEVAIQDRNSGKFSAHRADFEVTGSQSVPSLSDLTLVRRTDPFNLEADPSEPLRYEKSRVVPNLSGQVPQDAKAASLFFLIHPDASASEPATLEIEVFRNGQPVGRNPLPLRKSTSGGAVPYLMSIPANALPAGNYEVTATLIEGEKTSERTLSFRREGPELASAAAGKADPDASDAEPASDANIETPGIVSHGTGALAITALSSENVAPPSQDEIQGIIADARKRAISYSNSLPNFMCVERTDRSIDPAGRGKWRHIDSIAELLRFHDNSESRQTLEVNGKRSTLGHDDLRGKDGALSWGEFGGVLSAVFQPASKAEFQWKETDAIGGETVQVLSYRVSPDNSSWGLAGNDNWKLYPGFHGLLYIDSATRSVRRITLEADDLPRDFSIHAASILVDYDYVAIGAHDYLMPVRGTVALRQGKREAVLNEIEFRNYRRYASKTKVLYRGQPLP
jgi:VWFA-related protein